MQPGRPLNGKRPLQPRPADPVRPKTLPEIVNDAWRASGHGRGKHERFVQALEKAGFEVKHSVQGIDVRRRGSGAGFVFFRWPRKA